MGVQVPLLLLLLAASSAGSAASTGASSGSVPITVGRRIGTTAKTFLAHGWEPWTATMAFEQFNDPALIATLSHLRGQTIRFGGITADWLAYTINSEVSLACNYNREAGKAFTAGGQCPFSSGALDLVLDLCASAGIGVMFDLNELIGRNCTQPKPPKNEWCGDSPAPWETAPVRAMLAHIEERGRSGKAIPVAFELGNELFAPQHMPRQTAIDDLSTLASLLEEIWVRGDPPPFFATGTNDCKRVPNTATIDALAAIHNETGLQTGFSFHSYPGNQEASWNKTVLSSFLLNTTWLRTNVMKPATPCLGSLRGANATATGAMSLPFAVTEAQSMCGGTFAEGAATTSSFINGFFSIANLGMMAQAGAALVARWGIPDLLNLRGSGHWDTSTVASDFFLYLIYADTVGHGVLSVSGDKGSDALVYAHCGGKRFGANGTVTVFAANPSSTAVTLDVSLPSRPRVEWVLTAPEGDLASQTLVLNNEKETPLSLGQDGSLPPMEGLFCGAADCGAGLTLPPRSQGFFVLLAAQAESLCAD